MSAENRIWICRRTLVQLRYVTWCVGGGCGQAAAAQQAGGSGVRAWGGERGRYKATVGAHGLPARPGPARAGSAQPQKCRISLAAIPTDSVQRSFGSLSTRRRRRRLVKSSVVGRMLVGRCRRLPSAKRRGEFWPRKSSSDAHWTCWPDKKQSSRARPAGSRCPC